MGEIKTRTSRPQHPIMLVGRRRQDPRHFLHHHPYPNHLKSPTFERLHIAASARFHINTKRHLIFLVVQDRLCTAVTTKAHADGRFYHFFIEFTASAQILALTKVVFVFRPVIFLSTVILKSTRFSTLHIVPTPTGPLLLHPPRNRCGDHIRPDDLTAPCRPLRHK